MPHFGFKASAVLKEQFFMQNQSLMSHHHSYLTVEASKKSVRGAAAPQLRGAVA